MGGRAPGAPPLDPPMPVECVSPSCNIYVFRWPPLGVSTGWGRFEHVFNDDHQMSLPRGEG